LKSPAIDDVDGCHGTSRQRKLGGAVVKLLVNPPSVGPLGEKKRKKKTQTTATVRRRRTKERLMLRASCHFECSVAVDAAQTCRSSDAGTEQRCKPALRRLAIQRGCEFMPRAPEVLLDMLSFL